MTTMTTPEVQHLVAYNGKPFTTHIVGRCISQHSRLSYRWVRETASTRYYWDGDSQEWTVSPYREKSGGVDPYGLNTDGPGELVWLGEWKYMGPQH